MKKIIYLSIIFIISFVFVAYTKADFNPASQPIVDYGDVSDAQIAAAQASAPTTSATTVYGWFTPALQAELDSIASGSNQSLINWASVIIY